MERTDLRPVTCGTPGCRGETVFGRDVCAACIVKRGSRLSGETVAAAPRSIGLARIVLFDRRTADGRYRRQSSRGTSRPACSGAEGHLTLRGDEDSPAWRRWESSAAMALAAAVGAAAWGLVIWLVMRLRVD